MPEPIHPVLVHFPVVLAVLLPPVALAAFLAIGRGRLPVRAWSAVAGLLILLTATAWLAVRTGESQEETVEAFVPAEALHGHEEAAEIFLAVLAVLLVPTLVGLVEGRPGRVARGVAVVGSLVVLGLAVRVGHSGGQLVYVHGAASAYAGDGGVPAPAVEGPGEEGEEREDRERDESREGGS